LPAETDEDANPPDGSKPADEYDEYYDRIH
jgi:hypothetical protein